MKKNRQKTCKCRFFFVTSTCYPKREPFEITARQCRTFRRSFCKENDCYAICFLCRSTILVRAQMVLHPKKISFTDIFFAKNLQMSIFFCNFVRDFKNNRKDKQ